GVSATSASRCSESHLHHIDRRAVGLRRRRAAGRSASVDEEQMIEFRPLHGGQLHQTADHFGIPVSELLDFSANINPDGPPPAVLSCLREAINSPSIISNYPDLDEFNLRRCIAKYVRIRPENIAIANGFVPLLDAALRTLFIRSCLVPVPAFVEYRRTLERSR